MTFLYQMVNKERALLAKQGRKHATDAEKPELKVTVKSAVPQETKAPKPNDPKPKTKARPTAKPALKITVKEAVDPITSPSRESASSVPSRGLQTVGLHNVPKELVDRLKAEANRRSSPNKKVSMTDMALACFEIGLAELVKQPNDS